MIATVLIWKVTLDLAAARVRLFVCTRASGLLTVAQARTVSGQNAYKQLNHRESRTNIPLLCYCGVGAEGAEKILGCLTSTFENFLHFGEVSEDKIG